MKIIHWLIFVAVLGMYSLPLVAAPISIQHQHLSSFQLEIDQDANISKINHLDASDSGGTCSGVAIAPHIISTAKHCLYSETTGLLAYHKLSVNGDLVVVLSVIPDITDHVLIVVDKTFPNYVKVSSKTLAVNDDIHFWGNPNNLYDMYRRGYVSNHEKCQTTFDSNGFFGDSGSGVFNSDGEIVATISALFASNSLIPRGSPLDLHAPPPTVVELKFMTAFPYSFTESQLESIGLNGIKENSPYHGLLAVSSTDSEIIACMRSTT